MRNFIAIMFSILNPWGILLILLIAQYAGFKTYLLREIVYFYPANYDQAAFLPHVYTLYDHIKHIGFKALLNISALLPTGILFPLNALILFLTFEASRFYALLPNFLYFILLQLTVFLIAKKLSGKSAFGFLFIGLILTLNTPFFIGGIADYRMDFIAFCLYGILISFIIQSQVFQSRHWTILIALLAAFMIGMRFITAVYLAGLFSVLLLFLASQFFFSKSTERQRIKTKCFHLFLCSLLIGILIAPDLYLSKSYLYHYYVIGHTQSIELPFRGIPGTESQFSFYPNTIKNIHIGSIGKSVIQFLFYLYTFFFLVHFFVGIPAKFNAFTRYDVFLLIISIICPLLILSCDPAKSYVVAGIVVTPILFLMILYGIYVDNKIAILSPKIAAIVLNTITVCVLGIGGYHQWEMYSERRMSSQLQDLVTLNRLFQDVAEYSAGKKWPVIHLSIDYVTDYLNIGTFATLYYEKYGKLITLIPERLGSALFYPITEKESLDSLKASNVVILTVGDYPKNAYFPGNQSVIEFRSHLKNYADTHFHVLGDYEFLGYHRRVYVA